jgi:hypothetical protein
VTPRFGMAYDLMGDGRTALKASINKYVLGISHQSGNAINPVNRLANSTTRNWTDANGNFTPDCNLLDPAAQDLRAGGGDLCAAMANANFGKETPSLNIDPETLNGWGNRPYNWEFSVGVTQQLMPRVAVDVGYFRRWYGNFVVNDNTLVTAADYSPFSVPAPVDPGLPDGGGYAVNGLFDLNPNKVGQVSTFQTFASNFGKQSEEWNGFDATVNVRMAGAVLQGGMSTGETTTDNCAVRAQLPEIAPVNPYCATSSGYVTQFKFLGAYTLPRIEVQVSGTFQALPGPVIAANFIAPNALVQPSLGRPLSGGATNVTVNLVEPGDMYGERLNQLDLRFGKILRFGRTRTNVGVDVFNALNANPVLTENSAYAAWRTPLSILQPRYFRFSAQFDF